MGSTRVTYLVDGFNLYHSARDVEQERRGASTKWLDLQSLCSSYLHALPGYAELEDLYYFSALATHRSSKTVNDHKKYIRCLKDTGVIVELGQFKSKSIRCKECGRYFTKHEEKETDVAIASRLLEVLARDECDVAVVVSGDTDLASAYRSAERLAPSKDVVFAFPHNRANSELDQMAGSFKIRAHQYLNHQFADPYQLDDGTTVDKPSDW